MGLLSWGEFLAGCSIEGVEVNVVGLDILPQVYDSVLDGEFLIARGDSACLVETAIEGASVAGDSSGVGHVSLWGKGVGRANPAPQGA